MLRTEAGQIRGLFDLALPDPLRNLPPDLAQMDELLNDDKMLAPFRAHWNQEVEYGLIISAHWGRPTIPMPMYVRLMVLKHRYGWGYEVLVREVSDSLHLRHFCGIPLHEAVPDESTVRKLTKRLGHGAVDELIGSLINKATGERWIRLRAMRCDSTVVEADVKYPTDIGLVGDAVRVLTRTAKKLVAQLPEVTAKVRDRGRAVQTRMRTLSRTLRRRSGEAQKEVERLTTEAAVRLRATVREAKKVVEQAKRAIVEIGAELGEQATRLEQSLVAELEKFLPRAERVLEQVRQRFAQEKIKDRLVSMFDPDARPIRKGKLSSPTQFGSVVQVTELTANTKRGARGLLLPPTMRVGNPSENELLPNTAAQLELIDGASKLKVAAVDSGFTLNATRQALAGTGAEVFIVGSKKNSGSRRHQRRLARYRVGAEGRISHLKRGYGLRRSRLKGEAGVRIWMAWAFLAYNLHTAAVLPARK